MSIETGEYLLFFVIVIFQVTLFLKTKIKIGEFKRSIPDTDKISVTDHLLTNIQIDEFVRNGTLRDAQDFSHDNHSLIFSENDGDILQQDEQGLEPVNELKKYKIKMVEAKSSETPVFRNILLSLNKYLVRNRHSAADFNLIKDIVERNTDSLEDEINLTLSTPLYLGLMGTMLGIVIGLFSMSDLVNGTISDNELSGGIAILLGSVKIAMIASFVGLALTIYNSAIIFKGTKYRLEEKKNALYTFIQVELLPTLNQGIGATFESLQRNLSRFNEKFDTNLDRLSNVFDKNYESLLLYKDLLKELDESKVSEMTKYNVQVLKELNVSVMHFEKFNALFANVNKYLNGTYQLTDKTNELLDRTSNFEAIAKTIEGSLHDNGRLTRFLTEHFEQLNNHKQMVDASVVNVSFGIKDTFAELKNSVINSSRELGIETTLRTVENKKVFQDFAEDLRTAFEKQSDAFKETLEEKKTNLDYLRFLEPLLEEVKAQKQAPVNNEMGKVFSQLVELTKIMSSSNRSLKQMEENSGRPFFKRMFNKSKNEEK
jgi:hypothetical protein